MLFTLFKQSSPRRDAQFLRGARKAARHDRAGLGCRRVLLAHDRGVSNTLLGDQRVRGRRDRIGLDSAVVLSDLCAPVWRKAFWVRARSRFRCGGGSQAGRQAWLSGVARSYGTSCFAHESPCFVCARLTEKRPLRGQGPAPQPQGEHGSCQCGGFFRPKSKPGWSWWYSPREFDPKEAPQAAKNPRILSGAPKLLGKAG